MQLQTAFECWPVAVDDDDGERLVLSLGWVAGWSAEWLGWSVTARLRVVVLHSPVASENVVTGEVVVDVAGWSAVLFGC